MWFSRKQHQPFWEINSIIFCCYVFFLQVHADVSMDLTLTLYDESYNLKRCGGSFICLYLFFSVGYLQVTTQKPITWKMAQWSQALTTSRYVFFLITFDTINLFSEFPTSGMNRSTSSLFYFKSPTQPLLLLAFSFLKRLYCVGFRQRKSRFCTETHFFILLEIVLCGEDASIGDRAHFLTHIWWNKRREEVREQSEF